ARWSNQLFSADVTAKLIMAAPITTVSAAAISAISLSDSSAAAFCAAVGSSDGAVAATTNSLSIWAGGLAPRSRTVTDAPFLSATAPASDRATLVDSEASPRGLERTRRTLDMEHFLFRLRPREDDRLLQLPRLQD